MPLPTNNSRPSIPYHPQQVLPNHNRYEALGKSPPTAQQLDGDFNGILDLINTLSGAVNDATAGIFPGADNQLNADKLPTTDGEGNISWTHITPFNLTDHAIQTRHLQDAAVTPEKIQPQAVGTNQLAEGSVTVGKINAANAASGDVLTANGAGGVSFQANTGRILQIVSYEDNTSLRDQNDPTATAQNPQSFKPSPFRLRITPLKTGSKILLYYSINVGAGGNQCAAVTLCKNDLPFKTGRNDPTNSYLGVTHNIFSSMGQLFSDGQCGCYNFSSLFVDTGVANTLMTYELKKAHPSTSLNSGFMTSNSGGRNTISVMHAIELDL